MTELQSCQRAKLLLAEMHTPYIVCVCVHTAVVGRTTVTRRGHSGHTHESQAVAQLLHGEFTGVTQRDGNNRINIHHRIVLTTTKAPVYKKIVCSMIKSF